MDYELYRRDPYSFALELTLDYISNRSLLIAALKSMTKEDIRAMLDANKLSPRFLWTAEDNDSDRA